MSLSSRVDLLAARVAAEVKAVRATIAIPQTFTYTGPLATTTDTGANRWYNDTGRTLTIQRVRATAATAPTGRAVLVDVNRNGTTIFTTQSARPSIAAGGLTATAVPAVTSLADGQYLTVNIDQAGNTTPGADLTVTVVMS